MVKGKRAIKSKKSKKEVDIKPDIQVDVKDEEDSKQAVDIKVNMKKETKDNKGKLKSKLRYFSQSKKGKERQAKGVVYVSSLPHGFYEKQLEGYFGQFGKVTGVYVPKSKKTGRAKGYAFIEFLHPEVAEIAAETMNNYLMFNRLIKTELIPPEKQRPYMFSERFKLKKHQRSETKVAEALNKRQELISKKRESYITKSVRNLNRIQDSLRNMGVDYKIKVAGLHEDIQLTGIKNIDPENPESPTSNKGKDKVETTKKLKGKKSGALNTPKPQVTSKQKGEECKTVVLRSKTRSGKNLAKVITEQHLLAGKDKVAKVAKLLGITKDVVQNVTSIKNKLPKGNVNKGKKAASPAKRKGNNRPKLETTV